MNKYVTIAGGTVLIVGGAIAIYYLLNRPNGNGQKCSDFNNEYDCVSHDCYWYNNSCHSSPQPVVCENIYDEDTCINAGCNWYNGACHSEPNPCDFHQTKCYPGLQGYRACTYNDNLCECDGNEWNLIEKDSQICKDGITHNKCFVNEDGISMCMLQAGPGTNECPTVYQSEGCPCGSGISCIDFTHFCEPTIQECVKVPPTAIDIIGNDNNWNYIEEITAGERAEYLLDDTWAVSGITGDFTWSGSAAVLWTTVFKVYGGLRGNYNLLGQTSWDGVSSGTRTVSFIFEKQAIDSLLFEAYNCCGFTTRIESFIGKLTA